MQVPDLLGDVHVQAHAQLTQNLRALQISPFQVRVQMVSINYTQFSICADTNSLHVLRIMCTVWICD